MKNHKSWCLVFLVLTLPAVAGRSEASDAAFKAGVASRVITPTASMWMSGYASRNKPSEGKLQDLFVKVLALENDRGSKFVLLTSDLVGIPRELSNAVAEPVQKLPGVPRARLFLT